MMNKIIEWFKKPINAGSFVGILVLLMPYLPEKIRAASLIVGTVVLFEEIIRYFILGKPIIQIIVMIQCLVITISLMILSMIDTYFVQLFEYKIYLGIIATIAFVIAYSTLMVHAYINHIEARNFITKLHIVILFLICFVGVMAYIVKK